MSVEPEQLVDALYGGAATPPPRRVNHAKGILLRGHFVATRHAARLSVAPHFQGQRIPILVRFSNFGGAPDIPDNAPRANPRGLAIRFTLPGGATTDLVAHSANGFPARTPAEFLAFLHAANRADTQPEDFERHLVAHEAARRFVALSLATPRSYLTEQFHAMHAFVFTGLDGRRTAGRYIVEPETEVEHWSDEKAAALSADFLQRDIRARVARGQARMKLTLQVAGTDDRLDDISVAWPDDRPRVDLGAIALTGVTTDETAQERVAFDPARLTTGIESAGDPMLAVRHRAYADSFARRHALAAWDRGVEQRE
ncbi:catalase family peroxidase [Burkholderia ubonensis]|uniref:catalase family peroxidase n=1 Tax=Burkholderia ubonensis TaxID=101571 RepID=UPI000BA63728|nr:catalase family peroxidase [Burkholderia ubonensis]PAK11591.1 hypothetical protein CJO66_27305 [Burkholderia ubonensis]RQP27081.1 catalase [Burkholderia ubonensis]RQP28768.1 catalase [Burkholderia ubonensis]RQP29700.1 catalase [Burkholderia ubonensis]RQP46034.1 catalase [Burkholderia ubonensis]